MATVIFLLLTTVHFAILSQGSLFASQRPSAESKILCTSEVCRKRAEVILSFVDETKDPCDDFYLYACGNRMKQAYAGAFAEQARTVRDRIKDVFHRLPIFTEAKNATEKAAIMYQSCLDKSLTEEEELVAVKNALEDVKLGRWPLLRHETKPFESLEDILLSAGLSGLLEYTVTPSAGTKEKSQVLVIWHPDSAFRSLSYLDKPEKMNGITHAHISLLKTAAEILRPDLSSTRLSHWANFMTSFLLEFEKVINPPTSSSNSQRKIWKTTIKEVESEIPKFPLLKLLNNDLKKVNVAFSEQDEIIVGNGEIFTSSMNFLLDQDPIDVFNYVGSRTALAYLKIASKKFRAAMSIIQKERLGADADENKTQSRQCFNLLSKLAPDVVTKLYVEKFVKHETKQQATQLLRDIGATYSERLKLISWMDRATKDHALRKLSKMTPIVAFTEGVLNATRIERKYDGVKEISRNVSLPRIVRKFRQNKYFHLLSQLNKDVQQPEDEVSYEEVNGYYMPSHNLIAIQAGILGGIYFQSGLPEYINLGGIGVVMGHEITHGYDDDGRHYGENGALRNWWTNYTSEEFDLKAQCFVEQYEQIFDPLANMRFDGTNTLGENIADNGGMRVAFATYMRTQYGKPQVTLPGLEKYTPEQLFFISNAMVWCGSVSAEAVISTIKHDEHSPKKYRVNIPMQNMDEFSAAFQCKPGSRMRLRDGERCVLW